VAKLKAPLLSLGAAGQLGKTMVFFSWKGINAVREYVIPTNPRTALQTTQRGYITDAVAKVHEVQGLAAYPLQVADQTAYSALATAKGRIITWFNQVVKLWVDVKVAGQIPIIYCVGQAVNTTRAAIDITAQIEEETPGTLLAGHFYLGLSRTNLIHSFPAGIESGEYVNITGQDIEAWTSDGDKVYWQFRPDAEDPCEGADSGIYHFIAT